MRDCFAYVNGKCSALETKDCDGCSFYKTKEQYEMDRQKALERIRSLNVERQKYIFEKYYGGEKS